MKAWNGHLAMLMRRELWEHRALWRAPLAVVAGVVLLSLIGPNSFGPGEGPMGMVDVRAPVDVALLFGRGVMTVLTTVLAAVSSMVVFAYLLDCLYAERKDRSILFWKSLPVSDMQAVLAKVGTGLLVAPLVALLIAAVALPLLLLVLKMRYNALDGVIGLDAFLGAYGMLPRIAMTWLWGVLWYSPIAAYLLLASVLATRVPLMFALLPPVVLVILEGVVLGTYRIGRFIGGRLAPWQDDSWSLGITPEQLISGTADPDGAAPLLNSDLWLGVAAAAVMVYIVIRLRRYRDDT